MLIKGIEFPDQLLEAQAAGELVIFAGAGVSRPPPSNLPLFGELSERIGQNFHVKKEDGEPDDRYLGRLKNHGVLVHTAASNILLDPASKPQELHKLLLEIAPSKARIRLVTTNFDAHFSTAVHALSGNEVDVFYAPALPLGDDFNGIVYLHGGAAKDPSRCVLTDGDFGRAYLAQGWATRFLAAMFARYCVLFVGYSHNDTVMNYLARGLPSRREKHRFAFVEDRDNEISKWRFLGIEPLAYKKTNAENRHENITISIREWVRESKLGLLEKAQKIRFIAESEPPLEGEESDYVKFCLSKLDTARIFFKHARSHKWIEWLEKNKFMEPLFKLHVEFGPFERELAIWLIESFLPNESDKILAVIQNHGGRLHRSFCWYVRRGLRDKNLLPKGLFAKWITVLLTDPSVFDYSDWAYLLHDCRFPEDRVLSIFLLDLLTQPKVFLQKQWHFSSDDLDSVEFSLNFYKDRQYCLAQAWNDIFIPNLPTYASDIEAIILSNLAKAHRLMETCGLAPANYDPFYLFRQSINEPNDRGFVKLLDFLVSAAKTLANYLAENKPARLLALIDRCFEVEVPILNGSNP